MSVPWVLLLAIGAFLVGAGLGWRFAPAARRRVGRILADLAESLPPDLDPHPGHPCRRCGARLPLETIRQHDGTYVCPACKGRD